MDSYSEVIRIAIQTSFGSLFRSRLRRNHLQQLLRLKRRALLGDVRAMQLGSTDAGALGRELFRVQNQVSRLQGQIDARDAEINKLQRQPALSAAYCP